MQHLESARRPPPHERRTPTYAGGSKLFLPRNLILAQREMLVSVGVTCDGCAVVCVRALAAIGEARVDYVLQRKEPDLDSA
jgi:hypothetical protein